MFVCNTAIEQFIGFWRLTNFSVMLCYTFKCVIYLFREDIK